jgi:hypothetical protein
LISKAEYGWIALKMVANCAPVRLKLKNSAISKDELTTKRATNDKTLNTKYLNFVLLYVDLSLVRLPDI